MQDALFASLTEKELRKKLRGSLGVSIDRSQLTDICQDLLTKAERVRREADHVLGDGVLIDTIQNEEGTEDIQEEIEDLPDNFLPLPLREEFMLDSLFTRLKGTHRDRDLKQWFERDDSGQLSIADWNHIAKCSLEIVRTLPGRTHTDATLLEGLKGYADLLVKRESLNGLFHLASSGYSPDYPSTKEQRSLFARGAARINRSEDLYTWIEEEKAAFGARQTTGSSLLS